MNNIISDDTIEYVGILAKLELSEEEKEAAKSDMGRMLDYIDMLGELDTEGVEPMSHAFPVQNVFGTGEIFHVSLPNPADRFMLAHSKLFSGI